ncbi:MAG: trypsin-like peptidase domain-containing protein [Legionella sp.]|nr:trypsin-like peptidase domain-containing protein [Legionella sp.]
MPISVVKVFTTYKEISYNEPWRKNVSGKKTGTASLIINDGKRFVVTNEHVIRSHTAVHVTVEGSSKKFPANVIFANASCDLALLEITGEFEIFEKLVEYSPLDLDIPKRGIKLSTHGFPSGGQGYCVTEGSVSRVESAPYITLGIDLLRIQISAPINPGSSGGIAVNENDGKILGITSSGISSAQNIGYIIPSLIIEKFVNQYLRFKNNPFRSRATFPGFNVYTQPIQQKSLRNHYKLDKISDQESAEELGLLITEIPVISIFKKILKTNDVILAVDNYNVRSDGKINFKSAEISIQAYFAITKKLGDEAQFKVWRATEDLDFETINLSIHLSQFYDELYMLAHQPYQAVSYYVQTDGAIFVVPNYSFLTHYDKKFQSSGTSYRDSTNRPISIGKHLYSTKNSYEEQIVYLTDILDTSESLGIHNRSGAVESINDEKIYTITQLAEILEKIKEPAILKLTSGTNIILTPNSEQKEKDFCEKNGIQHRMSSSISKFLNMEKNQKDKMTEVLKQMGTFSNNTKEKELLNVEMVKESATI